MFCSLVNGKCFCYVEIPNASVQARHRSKIFYLLSYYSSSIRSQRSWQCVHSLLKIKHCLAVKPHKLSEQSVQKKKNNKKKSNTGMSLFFLFVWMLVFPSSTLDKQESKQKIKNNNNNKNGPEEAFFRFLECTKAWEVLQHRTDKLEADQLVSYGKQI